MYKKFNYLLLLIFLTIWSIRNSEEHEIKASHQYQHDFSRPIRGIWLSNTDNNYASREKIREIVHICAKSHINTIFMSVWSYGYTQYPSQTMKNLIG